MNTERLEWEVWSSANDLARSFSKAEHAMAMIEHLRSCQKEFLRAKDALQQAADDLHQYWLKEGV